MQNLWNLSRSSFSMLFMVYWEGPLYRGCDLKEIEKSVFSNHASTVPEGFKSNSALNRYSFGRHVWLWRHKGGAAMRTNVEKLATMKEKKGWALSNQGKPKVLVKPDLEPETSLNLTFGRAGYICVEYFTIHQLVHVHVGCARSQKPIEGHQADILQDPPAHCHETTRFRGFEEQETATKKARKGHEKRALGHEKTRKTRKLTWPPVYYSRFSCFSCFHGKHW